MRELVAAIAGGGLVAAVTVNTGFVALTVICVIASLISYHLEKEQ